MLRQEINLYHPIIKVKSIAERYDWNKFILANILFFIFMLLCYFYSYYHIYHTKAEISALQTTLQAKQQSFELTKKQFPQFFFSGDVTQSVADLKNMVESQAQALEMITLGKSFKENLTVLSEIITPNVWLTSITIDKNGTNMVLQGKSFNMEAVHFFLENAAKHAHFAHYQFVVNNIDNNQTDTETTISFEINIMKSKS